MPTVIDNLTHFEIAFSCLVNYKMTKAEHNCDEWGLFENPKWLLDHYFKNSGVGLSDSEKKEVYDFLETPAGREMMAAFLNPENRRGTEKEYGCNEENFKHKWYLLIIRRERELKKREHSFLSVMS
jgi:hypothetical protein